MSDFTERVQRYRTEKHGNVEVVKRETSENRSKIKRIRERWRSHVGKNGKVK